MELKIGDCEKVRLGLFKKQQMYEAGDRGLVLERADGGVCIYATDAAHGKILACVCMCKASMLAQFSSCKS